MATTFAWLAVLFLLPVLLLLWLSESPQQRARRMRRTGIAYISIGARLGVSTSTARRWCL